MQGNGRARLDARWNVTYKCVGSAGKAMGIVHWIWSVCLLSGQYAMLSSLYAVLSGARGGTSLQAAGIVAALNLVSIAVCLGKVPSGVASRQGSS